MDQLQCSDVYDPNHSEADWSGFVPKKTAKKFIPPKHSQIVNAIGGNGLTITNNANSREWLKPAKRIVGHKESDTDEIGTYEGDQIPLSSTFSLIGGPAPINDPQSVSPSQWETESQVASRKKATSLCQRTDRGRSMHVSGLKRKKTCEVVKTSTLCLIPDECFKKCSTTSDGSLTGSNKPFSYSSSFLEGLGKVLVKKGIHKSAKYVSTAPYATDGKLPIDPYNLTGERRKDLLLENYSSVVPGYTGKCKGY